MSGGILRKKEVLTLCVPIPGFIPRQLAIDVLHNHSEVITLNPLVMEHKKILPPKTAAADEYQCVWYEITERIQVVPGLGKMGSGKINFNGCFLDVPWGLQTHIYAPMSVDMRANYRIAGNQPGIEQPAPRELGLEGVPADGLYLRTDIVFECNITLVSFVRSQLKTTIQEMVSRIVKRAEKLDADVLQGMFKSQEQQPRAPDQESKLPNELSNNVTSTQPNKYDGQQPKPQDTKPPFIAELPAGY